MDVKDLRIQSALNERNNDGSKYSAGGGALPCNRNKSYQDIGSNPLAKAEAPAVRPCAVIGPDRVVPPPATANDAFLKKVTVEPWLSPENVYRRPPEYPLKPSMDQNPSRNISPRQTFQENMQRIMVPPNYSALKHTEDVNYNSVQDRSVALSKNAKPNVAPEAKYCDVPYTINNLNETKNIRDADNIYVPSVNPALTRTAPVWPPAGVNVHAPRTFATPDIYPYSQYQSCAGPRPPGVPVNRTTRVIQDEAGYPYPEHYYQDAGLRYKPYPHTKERYPQPRYEYISNYPHLGSFHPSQIQHKYDIPKPGQPHPYPVYPHLKYVENRIPDPSLEGYPRPTTNQQSHYNIPFRNQVIHSSYAPMQGNIPQTKIHPYPPDVTAKVIHSNKLPFENSNKMYVDYENSRTKTYPAVDNYFVNEMSRLHPAKNQMMMPNYSRIGMMPPAPTTQYRKDNPQLRPYEYMAHYRNLEHSLNNNIMMRHSPQFSPSSLAISPTDSTASNETSQTQGTSQEDCGYVSQSSTTSVRSMDSMYKAHNEFYKRYDYRYSPVVGNSPIISNPNSVLNSNENKQKQINVRQFLQMWNDDEGDNAETNNSKEIVQNSPSDIKNLQKQHTTNQDQLYVLGLVNVPSEELGKYEHIQKISKLPENIKGYNNLELLSQFEEAIQSSSTSEFKSFPKEYQMPPKESIAKQLIEALPRPVSPLDVEAKISQSVIHKEVGCNFEIRPCSPKMLNVGVATPAQNVLGERAIEKVSNPLLAISKSPIPLKPEENSKSNNIKRPDKPFTITDNPSCKMTGSPYEASNMDSVKTNYSLQDLEINSGVCLASLPRLDNEIELNFPEVNQQFINANKKESNTAPTKAQSKGDQELCYNITSDSPDLIKSDNAPAVDKSEKEFTKLINYRKNKPSLSCNPENNPPANALRTDSVIIKNPENIKNMEDKYLEESNINLPMNLSSQSINNHNTNNDINQINNDPIVALDFSLNKPNNGLPIIDFDKNELTNLMSDKEVLNTTASENVPCSKNEMKPEKEARCEMIENDNHISNNIISDVEAVITDKNPLTKEMQSIKYDHVAFSDEFINSDKATNDLRTILENVDDENVIIKNSQAENVHSKIVCNTSLDINIQKEDEEMSDVNQQGDSEENDILNNRDSRNVTTNEKYITRNDNIHTQEDKIRDSLEAVLESSTENLKSCEDTVEKLCQDNVTIDVSSYESKQTIDYFQNKHLIETDEISATLEKIFEGTNDDIMSVNAKENQPETPISRPTRAVCKYQSKELHSPCIQKLLLHSEGLCSVQRQAQKESNKCNLNIQEPEDVTSYFDIEKAESQHIELDDTNKKIEPYGDIMTSETSENKVSETLISDEACISMPLFDDSVDADSQSNSIKVLSTTTNNHILDENNLLKIEIEEKQEECAGTRIKINQMQQDNAPELHLKNDNECELKHEACKSDLNSEEIADNDVSICINNVDEFKVGDVEQVRKEICKESQDQCPLETIAQTEKCVARNTSVSVFINNNKNEENITALEDSTELERCESECKNVIESSEDLTTSCSEVSHNDDDDVYDKSEHTQNAVNLEKEDLVIKLDKQKNIKTEKSINASDESSSSENISYNILENSNKLNDEEPQNQNLNILLDENNAEKSPKAHDGNLNENHIQNDILQFDKTVEEMPIPISSYENTDETKHQIVIKEQDQINDLAKKDVHDENDSENSIDNLGKRRFSLKRSYSDSELHRCKKIDSPIKDIESTVTGFPKRRKLELLECSEQSEIAGKLCSIIQNSRRNSVSAFYNEEDVSFCILIEDNCIIAEENEGEKICFAEIEEDCITEIHAANDDLINEEEVLVEEVVTETHENENELYFSDSVHYEAEKSSEESWLDDVACVETVVSDDVAEEVIYDTNVPTDDINIDTMYDTSDENSNSISEHIDELGHPNEESVSENICHDETYAMISHIGYDDSNMSSYDAMDPRKVLYKDECLERVLSESNSRELMPSVALNETGMNFLPDDASPMIPEDKENIFVDNISLEHDQSIDDEANSILRSENDENKGSIKTDTTSKIHTTDDVVNSCESSVDNVFNYKTNDDDILYTTSSSPEVSSTTSEEKNSSLVLKITKFNGSRVSQINEINHNRPRCKFTEKKEYSNMNGGLPNRPLLTKAAQKYIPPIKESISDLKIKLSLPEPKLLKLKQLKLSKTEPKKNKSNSYTIPKKPKPNFEDVLKNIDEVQIKMHKEKSKRTKPVPKVVIKKGHNGSHYTSSADRKAYNPDLTGRKWQPWVFLEKNHFIDKMVMKNKTKAIFSHRQNTYVLAEKFKKYKAISSAKFVISAPNSGDSSKGQLKYTIKLKHTY